MGKTLAMLVAEARASITEISVEMLQSKISSGADLLLVDVREPAEWGAGHIAGAVLIPRGILESSADLEIPKRHALLSAARAREVVLYCASGGRSAFGAQRLEEMGFTNVASLAGGFGAWEEAALPVVND